MPGDDKSGRRAARMGSITSTGGTALFYRETRNPRTADLHGDDSRRGFWDEKAPDIFDELIAPPGSLPLPRDSTRVKQTLHPTHLASQTKTCLKVSLNDARASPPCPDRFHVTRVNKIPDRRIR